MQKRAVYEDKIRRAYFHVKVLDDMELSNWRGYLDFEESGGDNVEQCFVGLIRRNLSRLVLLCSQRSKCCMNDV